jgi:predicted dehydrogenase
MSQKITLAIIGCGARGSGVYARLAATEFASRVEVVALAEPNPESLKQTAELCHVKKENCFPNGDALLKKGRLADALVIATMDRDHVAYAKAALKEGYDILLEKPISPEVEECLSLEKEYEKHHQNVVICHVLRYSAFYSTLKSFLDSGRLGQIVNIEASENVAYWHECHSFVRGNWGNSRISSPMILQKSCHDMDIFVWLCSSPCHQLSSIGNLKVFKKENAPEGAADRCLDCPLKDCLYDARKIYLSNKRTGYDQGNRGWPIVPYLTLDCTRENIVKALKEGPYGRCVYHCDNDVVDHEQTLMQMENGITIAFTMSAFSMEPHRHIKIMGTKGLIEGDDLDDHFNFSNFAEEKVEKIPFFFEKHLQGHGGGDVGLFNDFLELEEKHVMPSFMTTLTTSLESHYMCFAAEKSRLAQGQTVLLSEIRKK